MPAHNDNDTGMRFVGGGPAGAVPPRSLATTLSRSASTPECRSSTGLGGPVVPDVNCTRATSGS